MGSRPPEVVVVMGPTGVGKSLVAIALAQAIGGEIISVDSMQVYRGMDIGTGKVPMPERQGILHHLIDIRDISEGFSAADFVREARMAMAEVRSRRRIPVFCGGTAMYLKAAWHGLEELPPPDLEGRRVLEQMPAEALIEELRQLAPEILARVDVRNRRRMVRAIERARHGSGKRQHLPEAWRERDTSSLFDATCSTVILRREPGDLRERIQRRVVAMFDAGLVLETERLLDRGLARNRIALQALGYRQVFEHLQGQLKLEETLALIQLKTWQYARRQMTWFRNQFSAPWEILRPEDDPAGIAERLVQRLGGPAGQGPVEAQGVSIVGERNFS